MTDGILDMRVIRCWCCPNDKVFFMQGNPCTWPDCLNSDCPDPNGGMDDD